MPDRPGLQLAQGEQRPHLKLTKNTQYLALEGGLWDAYHENFEENNLPDKGATLHKNIPTSWSP